ncbi:serine hydrolase domain-containing protein [Flavobacterium sp. LT1R49]|uniref:serine hydrolase domain-containing protein n=1 Tax=Flavobacterium arabinosi TaxID=3398737 RepID=UPI003A89BEBD
MDLIDTILIKQVEENKTPSVQYVIFDKDRVIHRFQSGYADIKKQKKTTENTTYNAFSITKTFTALSILQLAEKKKLDIEQPIKKYLPEFPYSSEITIRQLMSHSAGIPNPIPLSWIHLAEEHNSFDRNAFFSKIFIKNSKTKSKPNEKYAYSNLGYVLLGQLIEKTSGLSYEDYVRENILNPLNIKQTELDFTITNRYQHAKGYHKKYSLSNLILGLLIDKSKYINTTEGRWNPFKDNYVNGVSYGGLIGTSNALVKYIQELLKPNCKLIKDDYKKMLFIENYTNNNKATGMCLSWFKGQLNGKQYYAHAGGGGGYYCEIRIYPDLGIGSVIMFNRTGMTDERFLDKIDKYIISEK